tara:strand:- start:635 stop:1336 length:702 start_codon:yes stop_codon:yes gene_type:complete
MAGKGTRFSTKGYSFPKPLIEIQNKPMIQIVIENLNIDGNYFFLVQKEHYKSYSLKYLLPLITRPNNCKIIQLDGENEGAACTVLESENDINNDDELIIANADQWVDWSSSHFIDFLHRKEMDGSILIFNSLHPKHSFANVNENGLIDRVEEKKPISHHATVGIYYFRRGSEFVNGAKQMMKKNIRTNNEFYICPVYNELIDQGSIIYPYPVAEMLGLGTPEELERFLEKINN